MPDRSLATELASPKYAHLELERRWLINPVARPSTQGMDFTLIEDGYLRGTRLRLRRMTRGGEAIFKLTKKYETERPEARPMVTAYLTAAEFELLAGLPAHEIRKRRYSFLLDGQCWSLDLFEGPIAGLELVEAEAPDEAALAALVPPTWAAKEVTADPRYQCGTLAQTNTFPE